MPIEYKIEIAVRVRLDLLKGEITATLPNIILLDGVKDGAKLLIFRELFGVFVTSHKEL